MYRTFIAVVVGKLWQACFVEYFVSRAQLEVCMRHHSSLRVEVPKHKAFAKHHNRILIPYSTN